MLQSRAMFATDAEVLEAPGTPTRVIRTSTAASLFAQPLAPMLTVLGVMILVFTAITTARTSDMIAALWAANGLAAAVWLRSGRGFGYDLSFGALMAFGTTVAYLFMIETKGKSLETIDGVFSGGALAVSFPRLPFRGAGRNVEAGTSALEMRGRRRSSNRRRSSAQDAEGRELFRGRRGMERLTSDAFVPGESAIAE